MNGRISGRTRVVGLFGHPVQHSCSPAMHNAAFLALGLDYIYVPFDVEPRNLESALVGLRSLGIAGVNVTIPHKESVIRHLDWVSDEARSIGSVNTIHNDEGILKGYSTDGDGFIQALENAGKHPSGLRTVVLGAGGSARATVYALLKSGSDVIIVNRTPVRAADLADLMNAMGSGKSVATAHYGDEARRAIAEADLLVNCTSVGMDPNPEASPVPAEWLHSGLFVYDQVYNPRETTLLRAAEQIGAAGVNGLSMLIRQGALSFKVWTGCDAPVPIMESAISCNCTNS